MKRIYDTDITAPVGRTGGWDCVSRIDDDIDLNDNWSGVSAQLREIIRTEIRITSLEG